MGIFDSLFKPIIKKFGEKKYVNTGYDKSIASARATFQMIKDGDFVLFAKDGDKIVERILNTEIPAGSESAEMQITDIHSHSNFKIEVTSQLKQMILNDAEIMQQYRQSK